MSDGEIQQVAVPAATITLVDIYGKVIELQAQLAVVNEKLADLPDHEARLRMLETAKNRLYGVAVTMSVAASALGSWISYLLVHH